ncbi:uncharacterized protein RJT20DRAFT_38147 [Scheffersomyces xylosifermentans]|uniref:uncharacterized protein n=1 Tax=Scheffersomyces xylosifermentans TaxID=1304137 RepID=UPI00315D9A78
MVIVRNHVDTHTHCHISISLCAYSLLTLLFSFLVVSFLHTALFHDRGFLAPPSSSSYLFLLLLPSHYLFTHYSFHSSSCFLHTGFSHWLFSFSFSFLTLIPHSRFSFLSSVCLFLSSPSSFLPLTLSLPVSITCLVASFLHTPILRLSILDPQILRFSDSPPSASFCDIDNRRV